MLGDLALDFLLSDGTVCKTIVLAGENGTGKSTILSSISSFLAGRSFLNFEFIEYEVEGVVYKVIPDPKADAAYRPEGSSVCVELDGKAILTLSADTPGPLIGAALDPLDLRRFGSAYSKAKVDFRAGAITSTTSIELDSPVNPIEDGEDFTVLKQLLVNTSSRDAADYARENQTREGSPIAWPDFYATSRMYRFSAAFNGFFDALKFEGVRESAGEKVIQFKKNGKEIGIDSLSTGEKQVVFRGAYLLRNLGAIKDGAIFVDEPELSMHPKWQRKILGYYEGLFTIAGEQSAQLFFATHSDHVVREAFLGTETIVITLEREAGVLLAKNHEDASSVLELTSAQINYKAFDLPSVDFHIELYGKLQLKASSSSIKGCDSFIAGHASYDAARHGKPSSHGSTTYETLPTYVRNAIHHPDGGNVYSEPELRVSIELMVQMLG
ncbi:ATP-binding protein [Stenotrophomonas terrae]|uniref:AAA family ATPase n=1 Tax=Stenotrophomonas terrae TaxID=405446 RepID=UPI00320AC2D3